MELKDGRKVIQAKNRKEWRNWLEKNHLTESSVWLILYHKATLVQSLGFMLIAYNLRRIGIILTRSAHGVSQDTFIVAFDDF